MAKSSARTKSKTPATAAGPELSLAQRLKLREQFFGELGIDPRQFLQAFDHIPGLSYFVKDVECRMMLNTREYSDVMDHPSDEEIVGKRGHEYLAQDLADHYEADDLQVIRTGEPLRNIVEIGFNELGVPDWIITDKYPIRNVAGEVVGIMGIKQSLERCDRQLPHLGEVGKAAAFIRAHLGERILLCDIAEHVGMSERHLQRLFHKLIGMTVQQFSIHSRIHAAAYELRRSHRPMSEIALMYGFHDQSAFANTFRKLIGVPPREYRQQHLKNLPGSSI